MVYQWADIAPQPLFKRCSWGGTKGNLDRQQCIGNGNRAVLPFNTPVTTAETCRCQNLDIQGRCVIGRSAEIKSCRAI